MGKLQTPIRRLPDDVGDYLQATAFYTDGAGPGKSTQAISANAVEVALGRNAPVFTEEYANRNPQHPEEHARG